jgi:hypothetical protein
MKKILIPAALFFAAVFLTSCVEEKTTQPGVKKLTANVTTRVIGVGTSEDIAVMDSYSTYYALLQGVHYRIEDGKVKLKMDYSNAGGVSIETLAASKVTKPWNGFVIYDYPYSGKMTVSTENIQRLSASIRLTRPFSFLSKMLAKSLLDHYAGNDSNVSGTMYLTDMNYKVENGESVLISADVLLAEDKKK